jgi:hypothetical protein
LEGCIAGDFITRREKTRGEKKRFGKDVSCSSQRGLIGMRELGLFVGVNLKMSALSGEI